MAGKITLTTFGIGAYGLQTGIIHWMALGYQQWGFLSGSGSSDFTWTYPQSFTSSVYSIQLAMRSGGSTTASYNAFKTTSYSLTKWQGYMSLKEDVSFFLLAIGRQMQWGTISHSEWVVTTFTYPITMRKVYAAVLAREDAANNKTEYTVTLISKNRTSLQFNGWSGDANVIVIGS